MVCVQDLNHKISERVYWKMADEIYELQVMGIGHCCYMRIYVGVIRSKNIFFRSVSAIKKD